MQKKSFYILNHVERLCTEREHRMEVCERKKLITRELISPSFFNTVDAMQQPFALCRAREEGEIFTCTKMAMSARKIPTFTVCDKIRARCWA